MASYSPPNLLPVRGRVACALEGVASWRWRQLERFAHALRRFSDIQNRSADHDRHTALTLNLETAVDRYAPLAGSCDY